MAIVVPQPGNDLDTVAFGAPVANQLNTLVTAPWVNLPLLNGWISYPGYAVPGYRVIPGLGIVAIRGMVYNPAATNGTQAIMQLPTGIRPVATLEVLTYSYPGSIGFAQLVLQYTGYVMLNGPGGSLAANTTSSIVYMFLTG